AAFDTFSNGLSAGFVALDARQSARLRPTTVAIHDYGDVAGNSFSAHRFGAVLTVGSWERKANITGGKSKPKLTELRCSSPSAAATKLQDDCLHARGANAPHRAFCP